MKTVRNFRLMSAGIVIALGGVGALADDSAAVRPLVPATFDRLIPLSFPTVQTDFGRLHHTTFNRMIPTAYPTVAPDFGRLRQATFSHLVPSSFPPTKTKPAGQAN